MGSIMKRVAEEQEELSKTDLPQHDNVVKLELLTGGKSGGGNWLLEMEPGTIFLARHKARANDFESIKDFSLGIFCVLSKTARHVHMVVGEGPRQESVRVDPVRFVNRMDFIETIGKQHFLEVGDEDDGDRPI